MAAAMKIDLFNHFFPKRYCDEFINVPGLKDIGKRVQNVPTIANLDDSDGEEVLKQWLRHEINRLEKDLAVR